MCPVDWSRKVNKDEDADSPLSMSTPPVINFDAPSVFVFDLAAFISIGSGQQSEISNK